MEWLQYVTLGFAPGLFWWAWLRCKDRYEPEPLHLVARAFVLGALTPALVLAVRPTLEALLPVEFTTRRLLLDAFLVTALVEEAVKLCAMVLAIGRHRELDEPLDGVVYGGAAALGFASIETVLFVAAHQAPALALQRGFTTGLVHLACSGAIGWQVARLRLRCDLREFARLLLVGMASVALHGTYDALLLSERGLVALLLVLPVTLAAFGALVRHASHESRERMAAGRASRAARAPQHLAHSNSKVIASTEAAASATAISVTPVASELVRAVAPVGSTAKRVMR
ncbi:MAG: PrsW family intramembrane metalloprotease [Planctomycetes bacterium]|nr:PrsW family intramembrane metalloprotease [Planctomycetota bacterium]